jgi:hypothetical protein
MGNELKRPSEQAISTTWLEPIVRPTKENDIPSFHLLQLPRNRDSDDRLNLPLHPSCFRIERRAGCAPRSASGNNLSVFPQTLFHHQLRFETQFPRGPTYAGIYLNATNYSWPLTLYVSVQT